MAVLTGDTLLVGFWAFVDEVFSSDDPGPIVAEAFLAVGRIVFTLLVLPPLLVAVLSEVIRARGLAVVCGGDGRPDGGDSLDPARLSPDGESRANCMSAWSSGLTGAVAGFVYWAIAGRESGRGPPLRADVARILTAKAENRPAKV